MLGIEQSLVDLVEHFLVVFDVFFFYGALELRVDLLGQREDCLGLQLQILHVHIVDLVLDLLQLFIQTRLLGLGGIDFALHFVDLVRDGLRPLLDKICLLLDQFGLLGVYLVGLGARLVLLRLDRVLDEGISLLVRLVRVKLFDELLRLDLNFQLNNLLLKLVILSILLGNFLLHAHFGFFQVLLLGD